MSRAIDADALEKEGWSLNRTIRVDKNTSEYQTKPLRKVPTIEPQQRWIPVTERLPEHSCHTLVTTKWDTEYSVEYGFYWGEDNKWGIITNNVIAWMLLPESYKEG